jgi:hypothetical protein
MLSYDYTRTTKHHGVVDGPAYAGWRETKGEPDHYVGAIWGPAVKHVTHDEMNKLIASGVVPVKRADGASLFTHSTAKDGALYFTTVEWTSTYRDAAGKAWFNFLDACKALGAPDRVRFVFGFDS